MIEFGELVRLFTLRAGSQEGLAGRLERLTCVAASVLMRFLDWTLALAGLTVADLSLRQEAGAEGPG